MVDSFLMLFNRSCSIEEKKKKVWQIVSILLPHSLSYSHYLPGHRHSLTHLLEPQSGKVNQDHLYQRPFSLIQS